MGDNKVASLSAFYYSLNMLKMLRHMNLITDEEFARIAQLSAEYYDTEVYYV